MNNTMNYFKILYFTMRLLKESSFKFLLLNMIFSVIQGVFIPLNLYIWKNVIDNISIILKSNTLDFSNIYFWLVLYFLIYIVSSIISNLSQYIQVIYSEYVSAHITDLILTKCITLELENYDDGETYNEINKASSESANRSLQILQTLLQMIQNITTLIGVIMVLVFFNVSIVVLCFISTIPMFYISCKIMNKLYNVFNKRFEKLRYVSRLKNLLIQNENIKEIKVFNLGNYLKSEILNILYKNIDEDKYIRRNILLQNVITTLFDNLFLIIIKIIVIYISIQQRLTIGLITMYLSSVDSLKNSIQNVLTLISSSYEHTLYMQSIFNILHIESNKDIVKNDCINEIEEIRFEHVYFKYPASEKYVLEDINLTFVKNKTFALVGLNGAGKTTLIKLILNLYEPTKGDIFINNINICKIDRSDYLRNISAVFQDYIKYPFDIRSNIGFGDINHMDDLERIKRAAEFSGIDKFVETLPKGYETKVQKGWTDSVDLSIGQWQKLAISRAMMKKSNMIILDEPTASLDAEAEFEVFQKFNEMKQKKLSILVSHRFSSLRLADEIIVLSDNTVVEQGTQDILMNNSGEYKRLYKLQADMYK